MKPIILFFLVASNFACYSQTMQATIKAGKTPRTIDIYLKPSASFSQKDESMTVTLAIPSSVQPAPNMGSSGVTKNTTGPVTGITGVQPSFLINNFGATQREVYVSTETVKGASYYVFTIICIGTATVDHQWVKDQEQLIFSIQFNGCTSHCDPLRAMLVNLPNGGSNSNSYWYFQSNTIGDITNYQNPFYQNPESTIPENGGSSGGSALSTITLANAGPLPVNLTSFRASADDCNVNITWTVTQEQNLSKYKIERSENGNNFYEIGSVRPNNNSNTIKAYNFLDNDAKERFSYYRLRIIDVDGNWMTSSIMAVRLNCVEQSVISVYPTKSNGLYQVKLNPGYENVIIKVINSVGQEILKDISGKSLRTMNLRQHANGIYVLHAIQNESSVATIKLILAH